MTVRAGALNKYVVIERRTATRTATGSTTYGWTLRANVWGKLVAIKGTEKDESGQMIVSRSMNLFIRFRDDVLESDRLNIEGTLYDIRAVYDPTGLREELRLELNAHEVGEHA
jgi:SPP1 family predicted phage head-tail adaptor